MGKVRDDFDMITYETDSILYYNPEDLYDSDTKEKIRQAKEEGLKEGREKGKEEGLKEGKLEGIKEGKLETLKENVTNMLKNNVTDELILKYLNISEDLLINIKKDLG